MTEDCVEEDDIKVLLTEYSNWLSTMAIPKYFDEDININITLFINASIVNNNLSKFTIMLKYKFPNHCAWE